MGCTGSKSKEKKPESKNAVDTGAPAGAQPPQQSKGETAPAGNTTDPVPPVDSTAAQQAILTPSNKSVEAPAGRANPQDAKADVASTAAPGKGPRSSNSDAGGSAAGNADVDEDGNPVVLPKGDWVKTEGTPYYYSATENLYYHPPSCQFYDPTNEMWYDPEKDEWYHDDASDEEAA